MNLLLVLANVAGFLAIAASCLKVLESGPAVGSAPFSPAARLVLMLMIFLAIFAAIEALAWPAAMRPVASALVFVWGAFSVWRVWSPSWASFLSRPHEFRLFRSH